MKTMFACGLCCVLVGVGLAIAADDKQCQKPNPSTKACHEPDNAVASCDKVDELECATTSAVYVYEIEQFPDGTIKTDTGATKTVSANCYRWKGCSWDDDNNNGCKAASDWHVWRVKQKTVENPEVKCPIPEAG